MIPSTTILINNDTALKKILKKKKRKIRDIDKKIPNTSDQVKKIDNNGKIMIMKYLMLLVKLPALGVTVTGYMEQITFISHVQQRLGKLKIKMPDTTGLVTQTVFNTKVTEIVSEIPNTADLKAEFDTKLNSSNIVISNKTKQIEVGKKHNKKLVAT